MYLSKFNLNLRFFSFIILLILYSGMLNSQNKIPDLPALTGPIIDKEMILNPRDSKALEEKLRKFEKEKGSQLVVVIISSTSPYSIEEYSLALAEHWKLGRKGIDDGLILLVAVSDRKVRIEVGYGLEGAIPDAIAKQVIDLIIVPEFKAGYYYDGIDHAVDYLIQKIDNENFLSPDQWKEKEEKRIAEEYKKHGILEQRFEWFLYLCFGLAGLFGFYCAIKEYHILGVTVPSISLFALLTFAEHYISSYYRNGYFIFIPTIMGYLLMFILFNRGKYRSSGSSGSSSGNYSSSYSGSTYTSSSSSNYASSSSSSSSSYSGGGGSFGGGGASGSW